MSELHHPPQEPDTTLRGRWLALIGGGLLTLIVALSLVAAAIVRCDLADQLQPPRAGERPEPLQAASLRTELLTEPAVAPPHVPQAQHLHRWGWVDREAGLVHVPIDVAMQLWLTEEQQLAQRDQPREQAP